ncbi:MarP family serine protease [Streptomyces sp. G-5]|nr:MULTISPECIES: MarP family serine protease [unclassified Streptomyces]MCU4748179.1 MarP family serine protease [Streptomyces sp. G-5]
MTRGAPVNLLDVILVIAAIAFAISGYRLGLVAALITLAGFVGGAAIGVWLLPLAVEHMAPGTLTVTLTALLLVLVPAAIGQALAGALAVRLRDGLTWTPVRWADGAGGAVLNATAVLLVAWIAASALISSPYPGLNQAIRESRVLTGVQDRMPAQAPTWFSRAAGALSEAGFPRVFNPFERDASALDTSTVPTADEVSAAAQQAAEDSTVKIVATSGDQIQEGSGFVFDDGLVMTNAHVVEGAITQTVQVGGSGAAQGADVVLFDPETDVAVLQVTGLTAPALDFAGEAKRGDKAVVAGYPENQGLDLRGATVAGRTDARGQDIYGTNVVTRDVYTLRANVRPGNSGGPLLTSDGKVYGMVFARSSTDADTGYALTADQIRPQAKEASQSAGTGH